MNKITEKEINTPLETARRILDDYDNGNPLPDELPLYAETIRSLLSLLEWIPVGERLPETEGFYECYLQVSNPLFGNWREIIKYAPEAGWNSRYVTHWRPLPDLPEEKQCLRNRRKSND